MTTTSPSESPGTATSSGPWQTAIPTASASSSPTGTATPVLGAHVLGEYSAETVQVVATAMRAGMDVEQLAEMQFAYPTFTEAVSMAAQKLCRDIGIGHFPAAWSYLGPPE